MHVSRKKKKRPVAVWDGRVVSGADAGTPTVTPMFKKPPAHLVFVVYLYHTDVGGGHKNLLFRPFIFA